MNHAPQQENGNGNRHKAIVIAPARLPYHPALEERFGVGQAEWRALVDAIFPLAKEAESIILALSYCRARKLDPFKRVVHIVPMWNAQLGRMVETVWPGIGELRTTAFRTRQYAGRDNAEFGPIVTRQIGNATIEFPEWCQITAYRVLDGQKYPFPGPRVYWMECYTPAKKEDPTPNSMWRKRPFGQLDKCAEAAALRAAFPEEIGNDHIAEEMDGKTLGIAAPMATVSVAPRQTLSDKLDALAAGNGNGDPPHDIETGELKPEWSKAIIEDRTIPATELAAEQPSPSARQQKGAGVSPLPDVPASEHMFDPQLRGLFDAARTEAARGSKAFKKWTGRLNAPDFARIESYLEELREQAAEADAALE